MNFGNAQSGPKSARGLKSVFQDRPKIVSQDPKKGTYHLLWWTISKTCKIGWGHVRSRKNILKIQHFVIFLVDFQKKCFERVRISFHKVTLKFFVIQASHPLKSGVFLLSTPNFVGERTLRFLIGDLTWGVSDCQKSGKFLFWLPKIWNDRDFFVLPAWGSVVFLGVRNELFLRFLNKRPSSQNHR